MKRNSITLFLTSPGATTPVQWVNNAPDFTGFAEPTLSVLQNSWQAFLDSGEELEVISDPEPLTPEPDWAGFRSDVLSSAAIATWFEGLPAIHREDITAQVQARDVLSLNDALSRVNYDSVKVELNKFLTNRNIGVELP